MEKVRVRLLGVHIAYIRKDLYDLVSNFTNWFRNKVYERFELQILEPNDINILIDILKSNNYDNIGDWITQELRNLNQENDCKSINNITMPESEFIKAQNEYIIALQQEIQRLNDRIKLLENNKEG